jgi:hypothetical protein
MPMLAMLIWGAGAFLLRLPFSAQIAAGFLSVVSLARGGRREALNSAFARKLRGSLAGSLNNRKPEPPRPPSSRRDMYSRKAGA